MNHRAETENLHEMFDAVLSWSRARGWRGYNKHDGLNSALTMTLSGWARWPRIAAIQAVMRSPVNIRPLLMIRAADNPKGLALFIMGLADAYEATGNAAYLDEATLLATRLEALQSQGNWSGACWGYHYPWQDLGFFAPAGMPNAVVTSFVCEAFLRLHALAQRDSYLAIVERATGFFLHDLKRLKDTDDELCLSYMPVDMTMRVMDVSILIGAVLAQTSALTGDTEMAGTSRRLVRYVVQRQTDYGAWYYTDPPEDSLIRHDNYHTGFILDALDRYREATGDSSYDDVYADGLAFYARKLFNADGSPRWMSDKDYPHDVHGAAQGILTFARHSHDYPGVAERIMAWTSAHLYHPSGRFHYQQTRWYTKRFTLMRWCNAWMIRAMGALMKSGSPR